MIEWWKQNKILENVEEEEKKRRKKLNYLLNPNPHAATTIIARLEITIIITIIIEMKLRKSGQCTVHTRYTVSEPMRMMYTRLMAHNRNAFINLLKLYHLTCHGVRNMEHGAMDHRHIPVSSTLWTLNIL